MTWTNGHYKIVADTLQAFHIIRKAYFQHALKGWTRK